MSSRKRWHLVFLYGREQNLFFFGHRDVTLTDGLYGATVAEIRRAVEYGCRIFYFGGYGDFDDLCYQIVTKIKAEKPHLSLSRVYCVSQERYLRERVRYFNPEDYDDVIYLTPAFAEERENSGAYKAYRYEKKKKEKYIVNLF